MSQDYAWRATGPAAPRGGDAPHPSRRLAEFEAALAFRGVGQAFDMAAFALLAVSVFPSLFFSPLGSTGAYVAAAAVWGLAYVVAWAARAVFARFDQRGVNPRLRLAAGRVLFTVATVAIAMLPAARHDAWAPLLLVMTRVGQGLGLAALAQGRLALRAPPAEERRSRVRASALAGGFGLLAAAAILGGLGLALDGADFLAWGWRYPFVIALALNLMAAVGDLELARLQTLPRARGRPDLRLVAVSGVLVAERR